MLDLIALMYVSRELSLSRRMRLVAFVSMYEWAITAMSRQGPDGRPLTVVLLIIADHIQSSVRETCHDAVVQLIGVLS
jgi:hypothetical protein